MPNPTTLTVKVPEILATEKHELYWREADKRNPRRDVWRSQLHNYYRIADYPKLTTALKVALVRPSIESHSIAIGPGKYTARTMLLEGDILLCTDNLTLNPNVLDPEDAVLVARVLGAVLACDNGNGGYDPIYTCWHETLGAMVQCDALGNKTGSVNAGLKEWVLHSIPSLGLTR